MFESESPKSGVFETPAILKRCQKSAATPVSKIKPHPPPSRSSLHQQYEPPKKFSPNYEEEYNVLVFGFNQNQKDAIAKKFQFGNIKEIIGSKGNWITIKYSAQKEAEKALSYNGQVLLENTMIGVKTVEYIQRDQYIPLNHQDTVFDSQFIKKTPRRFASFWENLIMYLFNLD